MEKRTIQKLGLLCASVALCSAASWWSGNDEADRQVQKIAEQPVTEQVQEIKITVCVSGAVAKPGVTDEADMDRINLAQLCKDGGHIKVPRLSKARLKQKIQERKSAKADVISGEIAGDGHYNDAAQYISQKRAQEKWEAADGSQSAETGWSEVQSDGNRREEKTGRNAGNAVLVHLNSATETDLIQLPGVGNATARRILAFRNQHGFHRIEDIMQVPGIGPAKFARMKRCLAL